MTLEELISLFAYYIALEGAILAYCFSQIQQWRRDTVMLHNEWDSGKQMSDSVFKSNQRGRLKALKTTAPWLLLATPAVFAFVLTGGAFFAYIATKSSVSTLTFFLLIVLPIAVLVAAWTIFNYRLVDKGLNELKELQ